MRQVMSHMFIFFMWTNVLKVFSMFSSKYPDSICRFLPAFICSLVFHVHTISYAYKYMNIHEYMNII